MTSLLKISLLSLTLTLSAYAEPKVGDLTVYETEVHLPEGSFKFEQREEVIRVEPENAILSGNAVIIRLEGHFPSNKLPYTQVLKEYRKL